MDEISSPGGTPPEELAEAAAVPLEEPAERPRVLVVDDDERNLLAIKTVLEDIGEVVTADSGEEALRQLLKGEFAVILLDVYMPGLDGYETARIVRSREQTKRIPIVFLSAVNKETEHLLRGYEMGAVDYVFKPVEPVVLRSKVAVFVDLFAMTKEIERKARQEQALLDATLRANSERLKAEQDLRRAEQRQAAIIQSLPIVLYLEPLERDPRVPRVRQRQFPAITGFAFDQVAGEPGAVGGAAASRTTANGCSRRSRERERRARHFDRISLALRRRQLQAFPRPGRAAARSGRRAGRICRHPARRHRPQGLESQLLQARKMDAIGKLTGGIAHDFNNLLAAVLGGIGLIERRMPLDEDQQKIVGMTRHAAEQGSELVGRLLAFARRQQLEPAAIDIGTLSDGVDDLLAHTLGGLVRARMADRGRASGAPLPTSAARAGADEPDHQRARRHAGGRHDHRRGRATRRSRPGDDAGLPTGDYVVLAVSDNGSGIRPRCSSR